MSPDLQLGAEIVAFLVVAAVPTFMPGAEMALVTRNALAGGRSTASWTIAGSLLGPLVHGFASAVGLSALVAQSASAYGVLKLVGAGYLLYLGIRMILNSRGERHESEESEEKRADDSGRRPLSSFGQGFLTNILNPKPALFYLTVLPQFVSTTDPVLAKSLLLAGSHVALKFAWLSIYTYVVVWAAKSLPRSRVWARLEAIAGTVLVAFGVRLAYSSKP